MQSIRLPLSLYIGLLVLLAGGLHAGTPTIDFSREILPILSDNCFYCHGPDASHRKAGLRLDEEAAAKEPNAEGIPAIKPGKSAESELFKRITSTDSEEVMPTPKSNKKLTPEQIALLKQWIDEGAKWGTHWSFNKLAAPEVPKLKSKKKAVIHNPIDAFVLTRLAREKLQQSPEADRTTLIRRLSLDLTGLPPTPEEVDAFVNDKAKDAYERLVDRLLASPRYGERMAWDWMEISRYADTNGYQGDGERTMWPWRDWVTKAFNENLPYDQFSLWQLAGDLLPEATQEQKLATGFCRNYPINGEGGRIAEENRIDYVMDMAETMGTVWLGLTLTCSRCHDHKFDPYTKKEYFSLFAFFNQTPVNGGGGDPQTPPRIDLPTDEQTQKLKELNEKLGVAHKELEAVELKTLPRPEGKPANESEKVKDAPENIKNDLKVAPAHRNGNQLEELRKHFEKDAPEYAEALKKTKGLQDQRNNVNNSIVRVMVMEDMKQPRKTMVLDKGLYDKPLEEIGVGVPAKLPPLAPEFPKNRLGLAKWLLSPEHPLTARVTVNRIWQMFFGIGIVKTSEDFGVQGEFPKHPELLDWLASDFRDNGWDVKRLIRQIVTSATYRQSSRVSPEMAERDPQNRLLARGPRFRLPSAFIRDQALAASGLLSDKIGGPPVKPYQPSGIWEEATFGNKRYAQDKGEALYRRSLYVFWRRIVGPTMFFDTQSRSTCVVKPTRTNTPLHALSTLNDITYVEAARALAQRVLQPRELSTEKRLELAFRYVLARAPKTDERRVLLGTVERVKAQFSGKVDDAKKFLAVGEAKRDETLDPVEHAAWAATCLAILNLDEALTKE